MTSEPLVCSLCGTDDRRADVRATIANLEREARRQGRVHAGPVYAVADRCRTCRELSRSPKEDAS